MWEAFEPAVFIMCRAEHRSNIYESVSPEDQIDEGRFKIKDDVVWRPYIAEEETKQKFKDSIYTQRIFKSSALTRDTKDEDQFAVSKKIFKSLIPRLVKEYYGKYLAVIGNYPYEIGEDEDELFDRVTERYGDVPMCIGKIIETEEVPTNLTAPKFAIINDD